MNKKKNIKAFTLFELLLVIVVLAMTAVVGAPYYGEAHSSMNDGTAERMTMSLIASARSMGIAGRVNDSIISFETKEKVGIITVGSDSYTLPSNFEIKSKKSFKFGLDGKVTPLTDNSKSVIDDDKYKYYFVTITRKNYEKNIYVSKKENE